MKSSESRTEVKEESLCVTRDLQMVNNERVGIITDEEAMESLLR